MGRSRSRLLLVTLEQRKKFQFDIEAIFHNYGPKIRQNFHDFLVKARK